MILPMIQIWRAAKGMKSSSRTVGCYEKVATLSVCPAECRAVRRSAPHICKHFANQNAPSFLKGTSCLPIIVAPSKNTCIRTFVQSCPSNRILGVALKYILIRQTQNIFKKIAKNRSSNRAVGCFEKVAPLSVWPTEQFAALPHI